ncbi:hypothetical protein LXL04_038552 [Taraxacum kok-saghyz]
MSRQGAKHGTRILYCVALIKESKTCAGSCLLDCTEWAVKPQRQATWPHLPLASVVERQNPAAKSGGLATPVVSSTFCSFFGLYLIEYHGKGLVKRWSRSRVSLFGCIKPETFERILLHFKIFILHKFKIFILHLNEYFCISKSLCNMRRYSKNTSSNRRGSSASSQQNADSPPQQEGYRPTFDPVLYQQQLAFQAWCQTQPQYQYHHRQPQYPTPQYPTPQYQSPLPQFQTPPSPQFQTHSPLSHTSSP